MWDIHDLDTMFHRALLAPIVTLLYSGPASAVALDRFLSDQFQDEVASTAFDEWLPLIVIVWFTAIPLIQAFRNWDDNPVASVIWLSAFLGIALLPGLVGLLFVYRAAAALVILPALSLPFQWMSLPSPGIDVAVVLAQALTFALFAAVPLGAMTVQLMQLRSSSSR